MKFVTNRALGVSVASAAAVGLMFAFAGSAAAKTKTKSIQTEAVWVSFNEADKTVTVRVKKPGRGAAAKKLKRGKETTFKVKPTGTVLTKTTVAINGRRGELGDIPAGKTVNVYWKPDETDDTVFFARKIDVIFSQEELDEMWGEAE